MKLTNLPDVEFKVMVTQMLDELRRRMDKQRELQQRDSKLRVYQTVRSTEDPITGLKNVVEGSTADESVH